MIQRTIELFPRDLMITTGMWIGATCRGPCKVASEFQVSRRRAAEIQITQKKDQTFHKVLGNADPQQCSKRLRSFRRIPHGAHDV